MFLCHILVILKLFHAFSYYYICHGDFCLMNTDITILIWGEAPGTVPIQDGDLDKRVCSDCSSQSAVPSSLSLSSGLPIPWDTATLKLVQLMPLQWPVNVQMKEIHMFLPLNQNLEMIKLSEEGMSKAEIFWKLDLLHCLAKSWMQRKSFFEEN